MRHLTVSFLLLGGLLPLLGQENSTKWDVEIVGPLFEGKPPALSPKPEPIDFKVLTSRTQRMQVTEAPEMPDLPPVTGTIKVTVERMRDPNLPDPPPLPILPPSDPAVIARMKEIRDHYRGTKYVYLSATVYDRSRTFLQIYPNGKMENAITAWSNVDFNYLCGFTTFRIKSDDGTFQNVGIIMGLGNAVTKMTNVRDNRLGRAAQAIEIPKLPDLAVSGPSFLIMGDKADSGAIDTLSQIHELYRLEGQRLENAWIAREKARSDRKTYLLANPPKPNDVTIRFWKRN